MNYLGISFNSNKLSSYSWENFQMDRTEHLEKIKTIISYLKQKEYDE